MTAKQYLLTVEILQVKIDQKMQRAKECRLMAFSNGSLDYSKPNVQTSVTGSQVEERVIKYLALEQEIQEDILSLQLKKDIVTNEIHSLENAVFIKLLYKRYIEGKSLGKVARELKYSYDRTRHMHGEALKEFEKVNPYFGKIKC